MVRKINSLRDNITFESVVSSIKLEMDADIEKNKIFIVVEGDDDVKLCTGIFNKNIRIYQSYSGCEGIDKIVYSDVLKEQCNVIGIRDRDYHEGNFKSKTFTFDYNCNEIMLISSDDTFKKIHLEYYQGTMEYDLLREYILKNLKCISIIRKVNYNDKLNLKLEGVISDAVFDFDKNKISSSKIISILKDRNNKNHILTERFIQKVRDEKHNIIKYDDYLRVTNGHDFTKFLSLICRKEGVTVSQKQLEQSLRCAYNKSDFIKTELYKTLQKYIIQYNLKKKS